jgi:hypothetical protein
MEQNVCPKLLSRRKPRVKMVRTVLNLIILQLEAGTGIYKILNHAADDEDH